MGIIDLDPADLYFASSGPLTQIKDFAKHTSFWIFKPFSKVNSWFPVDQLCLKHSFVSK